ncbi:large ribosomal subunit protein uL4m-like isoform X2 [Ornithodoros turicata]|uniref:large ribosomal subunit protein uL4m-like isoform X2 n=1 Tax=Ornithodoros turicata TaxID=34597 RepID=UPI00313A1D56
MSRDDRIAIATKQRASMAAVFASSVVRLFRSTQGRVLQRFYSVELPITSQNEQAPASTELTVPSRPSLPIITSRDLAYPSKFTKNREAWVENLDTVESEKLGMVPLNPLVFGAFPRIDLLHWNVHWQMNYKRVDWATTKSRAEVRGGGRKPWPQKGLGKARHGSIRSPLWKGGGVAKGPRGPKTYFFMLPFFSRVKGLITALSTKFAQDDLKIVDSLDLPSDDPKFLEELVDERIWGPSVLFVDDTDYVPKNIALACDEIKHMNIMPVYGLNVYSMLKHDTLVITLSALEKIEERLLFHLNRTDVREAMSRLRKPRL